MSEKSRDQLLDEVFADIVDQFELPRSRPARTEERKGITIWVKPHIHEKYEEIQKLSKKKFNKVLRQVFERAVEKVFAKRAA